MKHHGQKTNVMTDASVNVLCKITAGELGGAQTKTLTKITTCAFFRGFGSGNVT